MNKESKQQRYQVDPKNLNDKIEANQLASAKIAYDNLQPQKIDKQMNSPIRYNKNE